MKLRLFYTHLPTFPTSQHSSSAPCLYTAGILVDEPFLVLGFNGVSPDCTDLVDGFVRSQALSLYEVAGYHGTGPTQTPVTMYRHRLYVGMNN